MRELAETLGLMSVKVEAREYQLELAMEDLKNKNEELTRNITLRIESGFLFTTIILFLCIYIIVLFYMSSKGILVGSSKTYIMMILNFSVLIFSGIFVKLNHHSLPDWGITLKGVTQSLRESLLFSLPVAFFGILAKLMLVKFPHAIQFGSPIFESVGLTWIIAYIPIVILQEIVFRGFIQTSIERIVPVKYSAILAIALTSLIFAVTHIFYSFPTMIATMFGSIFFGWLFYRQKTLAGVILSHYILGILYVFTLKLICW